ncbi:helix-turn-helix domain-containing protein [Nakamurella sp. PAMC28650]|uniref:helix-turn-helix domain-containing protein n=1 Tax=Nakamurella sp. PAMC28650 TaxID=2762325 RepID=UPI0021064258|nr:helix-turn-helix transcriptional regulator [Nakamurella sp. PAMC28650]
MAEENKLGQVLRRLRTEKGMTVRELAELTSIPTTSIFRVETGEVAAPRPKQLQVLARALGIDVEELYATAGYIASADLPSLRPYLRAKFGLSDQALGQVEGYVQALRDQTSEQEEREHDGDKDT